MDFIIIPTASRDKYERMITKHHMIQPVQLKDGRYVLPVSVKEIPGIDEVFDSLATEKEVTTVLKDLTVEKLTITDFKEVELEAKIISK